MSNLQSRHLKHDSNVFHRTNKIQNFPMNDITVCFLAQWNQTTYDITQIDKIAINGTIIDCNTSLNCQLWLFDKILELTTNYTNEYNKITSNSINPKNQIKNLQNKFINDIKYLVSCNFDLPLQKEQDSANTLNNLPCSHKTAIVHLEGYKVYKYISKIDEDTIEVYTFKKKDNNDPNDQHYTQPWRDNCTTSTLKDMSNEKRMSTPSIYAEKIAFPRWCDEHNIIYNQVCDQGDREEHITGKKPLGMKIDALPDSKWVDYIVTNYFETLYIDVKNFPKKMLLKQLLDYQYYPHIWFAHYPVDEGGKNNRVENIRTNFLPANDTQFAPDMYLCKNVQGFITYFVNKIKTNLTWYSAIFTIGRTIENDIKHNMNISNWKKILDLKPKNNLTVDKNGRICSDGHQIQTIPSLHDVVKNNVDNLGLWAFVQVYIDHLPQGQIDQLYKKYLKLETEFFSYFYSTNSILKILKSMSYTENIDSGVADLIIRKFDTGIDNVWDALVIDANM